MSRREKGLRLINKDGFAKKLAALLWLQAGGIIIFGSASLVQRTGIETLPTKNIDSIITIFICLLTAIVSLLLAGRRNNFAEVINTVTPGKSYLGFYFLLRILFIISYEYWFRGALFQYSLASWGLIPAVIINILLYGLLHTINGREEALISIPFGLLLLFITFRVGTPCPAACIHLCLTVSYEGRSSARLLRYQFLTKKK